VNVTLFDGPALPGSLRQINRLTVLRLLRQLGPATKPALAKWSGISRPTVAKLIDELETDGLAERVGVATSSTGVGKPGALYRFNADGVQCGAVFLTFDTARLAVVNGDGHIRGSLECPLGTDRRPEPVCALIARTFQGLLTSLHLSSRQVAGLGVGVPGLTSFQSGVVHFAPHFPQWQDVPVGRLLQEHLGIDVLVDNDCHVQAMAERHFGQGMDCTDFLAVESGVGVSAAFYLRGMLYRGVGETAGEFGHMTIQEDGPLCECGNHGCWETLASTTWMVRQAYQRQREDRARFDWLMFPRRNQGNEEGVDLLEPHLVNAMASTIFRAAREGQPEAVALVQQHATHYGVGLATMVNALNPQRLIIWGDSTAGGKLFLETVRAVVAQRALKRPRELCEIVFSSLPQEVGVLGAASLVIERLFATPAL
jgi:predicted NBD/HSP70 family sugar kinase